MRIAMTARRSTETSHPTKPRGVPKAMYAETFAVMTRIKDAALVDDEPRQASGAELRAIDDREVAAERSKPLLAGAMADITAEPSEAVALYRWALEQAAAHAGEPYLGDHHAAPAELDAARVDADKFRDSDALAEIAD